MTSVYNELANDVTFDTKWLYRSGEHVVVLESYDSESDVASTLNWDTVTFNVFTPFEFVSDLTPFEVVAYQASS